MANVSKFSGLTIHAGWFPMLTSKGPAHAFSKSKSSRGVAAKGYNQNFAKQVQAIKKQRGGKRNLLRTLSTPIITQAGMGAVLGGMPFPSGQGNLLTGERLLRGRKWSDLLNVPAQGKDGKAIYDDSSRYQSTTKKFQLRGNFVWYNTPTGGPKKLATAILENNFSFKNADKWYYRHVKKQNTRDWAMDTLGIDKNADLIPPAKFKKAVKTAQEVVIPKGPFKDVPDYEKGATTAQTRDVRTRTGESAELSEQDLSGGGGKMHGMEGIEDIDTTDEQAIKNFMSDNVIKTWDNIAQKVIDSEKKEMAKASGKKIGKISTKAAGKSAIKKSAEKLIKQAGVEASVEQMNKVKHEMAALLLSDIGKKTKSYWTEVIANGPRSQNTGLKNYAAMDLQMGKDYKFKINDVEVINAIDAGAAIIEKEKLMKKVDIKQHTLLQQITFAHNTGLNTELTRTHNSITTQATNKINKSVKIKTQVSFSPKIAKNYINNIIGRFGEIIEDQLTGKEAEIQKAVLKKAEAYEKYGEIFWASPYIGTEEGLNLT